MKAAENRRVILSEVHIRNFKSLRDCRVPLRDFQVLVGANASGKTSFLQALGVVSEALRRRKVPDMEELKWRGAGAEESVACRFTFSDGCFYNIKIGPNNTVSEVLQRAEEVLLSKGYNSRGNVTASFDGNTYANIDATEVVLTAYAERLRDRSYPEILGNMSVYQLDPRALSEACPVASKERPRLEPDGRGLVTVLDYMLGAERGKFAELEEALRNFIPRFKELILQPGDQPGEKKLAIRDVDGWVFGADQLSGGMLLFLGYLVLVYGHETKVLMLEEPENGIHPQRLKEVVELTKQLVKTTGTQVIMTSHSPYLLDFVEPEEILVFSRDDKTGETSARPLEELPGAQKRLKDYYPGELLFNFPEEELLR